MQFIKDLLLRIKNKYISNILQKVPVLEGATYVAREQWLSPVLLGKETISQLVLDAGNIQESYGLLKELQNDQYLKFLVKYYEKGFSLFGDKWVYADIITALNAVSKNIKVQSYLEIGVRTGRSMVTVARNAPDCKIVGFDMWIEDYAGMDNPGPDSVLELLRKYHYSGDVELIAGNSLSTVPEYFKKNPDQYFDLITVDGDHRIKGARKDLRNVLPHLKIGGLLVFDDIVSPHHPYLRQLWNNEIKSKSRYETFEFESLGLGVAIAVRKY